MTRPARLALVVAMLLAAPWTVSPAGATPRDPTRPPAATAAGPGRQAATLQFGGVIIAAGHRVALINGHVVHVGGEVAGVKVIEILPEGVRVSRAGRIEVLRLTRGAPHVKTAAKEKLR